MLSSIALKILAILVPGIAIFLGLSRFSLWPSWLHSNELDSSLKGSDPKSYVLTSDPVVVYVKDFISAEEAAHLAAIA